MTLKGIVLHAQLINLAYLEDNLSLYLFHVFLYEALQAHKERRYYHDLVKYISHNIRWQFPHFIVYR
jgi:hypothetical protein